MNDDNMNTDTNDRDLGQQGLENQGKGKMDQLGGKVQEGWGKLTNDKGDELQGKMKQGKGNLEEGAGQAESNIDSTLNR
jgi:uncharacterized protein YjbJ (UPF0337 family)